MIFKNLIQANLKTEYLGKDIEYYQIIDSTNKEAKSIINNNEATHGMMVITDNQKNGKGRLNNGWFMGSGKGLAMSIIYLKTLSINKATLIPLASGLAIAKALENEANGDLESAKNAAIEGINDVEKLLINHTEAI